MGRIDIVKRGITKMDVDCIVNAANERLLPGGGVCGAIFKDAGFEQLERACRAIGHCDTGSAVITPGFNLKAKHIIHAVGPVWNGGKSGESKLLYNCYRASITLAEDNGCQSIAFPIISSGIYGYPKKEAWEIAIKAADESDSQMNIYFAVLDDAMLALGREAFRDVFNTFNQEKYHEGMFEEYIREPNPEHWQGFPEMMWALGFKMDCYTSGPVIEYDPYGNGHSHKEHQDLILAELQKQPTRIVGNYIFSRYRDLTHWSDYGYPEEQGHYFFERAFPILEAKCKN